MNYIICPKCRGQETKQKSKCFKCNGIGVYAWFGGYVLFFKKSFNRGDIVYFWIRRILTTLVIAFLFVFGIIGIIAFLKQMEIISLNFNFFGFNSNLLLIFWYSVIGDMYLFYIYESIKDKKKKSWPKSSIKHFNTSEDWEEVHKIVKKFKIEVASSFSSSSALSIQRAYSLAKKLKHQTIMPIHLFAILLKSKDIITLINRLGISSSDLVQKIDRCLKKIPSNKTQSPIYSLELKKIILNAYALAGNKQRISLSLIDILESMVGFDGVIKEIFYDLSIDPIHVKNTCLWIDVYNQIRDEQSKFANRARFKPKGPINRSYTAIATPNLDAFSYDLTQRARNRSLGMCINRKQETKDVLRVLQTGKNGAILVGEPGVGKTTIINGIARKMVSEEMPKNLQDKRLVNLSISALISGASNQGEAEQRLQFVISEIARSGNIILFIKDIHNMVGVKTTQGELDLSEILAEAVKSGLIFVLATSTPSEYRRLIEGKDIGDTFQKIDIKEPDENTTIQILEYHSAYIESKEKVYFSYKAIDSAVKFSNKYLYEKFLPDKAINLLKETAIVVKNKKGKQGIVRIDDVAQLVSSRTGIPVTNLTAKESAKLLNLEDQIHEHLINQNEAVNMVSHALRRARTELRNADRPIVNLLFLGPTGVGKTELAKTVALVYFGDRKKMVRLDMSEYQEKSSIGRLIGNLNQNRKGQLTEAIRQNPSSLLLLDEIEKAHPDILNVFLQVMDDGRLTDAFGRTIKFNNVILINTSNAGTGFIQDEVSKGTPVLEIKERLVREKLSSYFRPEFLNRYDGVVVFKPLGIKEVEKIAQLMLNKLTKQLKEKGIIFKTTEQGIVDIAKQGFDPLFGARPLRRVIQNKINDVLAKYLLEGKVSRRDVVILEKKCKLRIEKADVL